MAADRKFFERFPHRHHRVRHTSLAEIQQFGVDKMPPPPAGLRWFTVIRQVAPGVRWRLFTQKSADADPDIDEGSACRLYEALARRNAIDPLRIEAQVRQAILNAGAQ